MSSTILNLLNKNKHFKIRFCLVNTIYTYLRLKNCAAVGKIFSLKCVGIIFAIPNLGLILFCILEIFKTSI